MIISAPHESPTELRYICQKWLIRQNTVGHIHCWPCYNLLLLKHFSIWSIF